MRKTVLLLLAGSLVLASCKKDKLTGEEKEEIFELPYSKEGVTASKSFMEKEGRDLITKIKDLPNQQAIIALTNFASLDVPDISFVTESLVKVGSAKEKVAALRSALSSMSAASSKTELYKLSNSYGVYTYDAAKDSWKKTSATDRIELIFPATADAKTNNAILTITQKSSGKTISTTGTEYENSYDPISKDYSYNEVEVTRTYDLPAEIKAVMKVAGTSVLDLSSTYTYHADALPSAVKSTLKFGQYSMLADFNNDNKLAKGTFSFSKANEVLISTFLDAAFDNISLAKLEKIESSDNLEWTNLMLNGNVSFKVGNLFFTGIVDLKAIGQDIQKLGLVAPDYDKYFKGLQYPDFEDFNNDWEAYNAATNKYAEESQKIWAKFDADNTTYNKKYYPALSKAINNHSKFIAVNGAKKEIIATVETEYVESNYTVGSNTYYEYYVEPTIIFGDGSKVSLEAFGETGFNKLVDDLAEFISKF